VKGVLALAEYMRRRDFKGCARAAARMSQTKQVLQMGVSCALRAGNWNAARRLCLKYLSRYPASSYVRSCRKILKGYQNRLKGKALLKRKNKQRNRRKNK
jgi:hypothetical protein